VKNNCKGHLHFLTLSIFLLCGFSLPIGDFEKSHSQEESFLEIVEDGFSQGIITSPSSSFFKNGTRLVVYRDFSGKVHAGTLPMSGAKRQTLNLPIPINEGDLFDLQQLSGVGENISQSMIHERSLRGAFHTWEELLEIPGIGSKKLETLKQEGTLERGWRDQLHSCSEG
jgi:competence ComEA-like helix-hairpin-helix protein